MYHIEKFILTCATPFSALGENNVYHWIQLPTRPESFETYKDAASYITDLCARNKDKEDLFRIVEKK